MFYTEVKIEKTPGIVVHGQKMWTIGSCFADEIGQRLQQAMFDIRVNPCGTLYNPLSIARMLIRIANCELYSHNDIFCNNGLWHCMDFHSSFSNCDQDETLQRINNVITTLHSELPNLKLLTLTFGSARAFIRTDNGIVAGNCHKLPAENFKVTDLTADEIVRATTEAITHLRTIVPQLRIIYTVSPIRHKAYGFHADRLSKANLLIAVDRLCQLDENATYFPAYEIMNDELRDYRFYAADMIHPSEVACNHIYSRFADTFFTNDTRHAADNATRLSRRLAHRPINIDSTEYATFKEGTQQKIESLSKTHPTLAPMLNRITDQNIFDTL